MTSPSVTLWNPALNEGAGGVAVIGGTAMRHQTAPLRVRASWPLAVRIDPDHPARGACGDVEGLIILVESITPYSPSAPGKKRGTLGTAPTVNLEAGTATYSYGEADKPVAERKAEMKAAITARRWEVETGGIVVSGAAIATDALTQAKLSGALQLVQDDDQVVIDWKGADGTWVQLDAATVTAVARAVGLHVQACFSREKALHEAVDAAEDGADLDPIDVEAGTITVEGVPTGEWP